MSFEYYDEYLRTSECTLVVKVKLHLSHVLVVVPCVQLVFYCVPDDQSHDHNLHKQTPVTCTSSTTANHNFICSSDTSVMKRFSVYTCRGWNGSISSLEFLPTPMKNHQSKLLVGIVKIQRIICWTAAWALSKYNLQLFKHKINTYKFHF